VIARRVSMAIVHRVWMMAVSLAVVASSALARAQSSSAPTPPPPKGAAPPVSKGNEYSPYEKQTIDDVLKDRKAEIDPDPEGKTVEAIDVVPLEVIEKRDPAPDFLNVFHTTTRPWVIDQEVLVRPGQPYRQALVDETTRNLRDDIQTSLVVVLPIRGSTPDKVRLIVIAKDVWSLRLNSDLRVVDGTKLEYLFLQPSEWNVAGTHHNAGLQFIYQPLSYSLGATYDIPRFLGSWVALHADVNAIINTKTGHTEGSFGSVSATQPLYSALTEWSWGVSGAWNYQVFRRYTNAQLGCLLPSSNVIVSCESPGIDPITHLPIDPRTIVPFQYTSHALAIDAHLTRSFGWKYKNDFTLGAESTRYAYSTPDLDAQIGNYDPASVAAFLGFVPHADTRVNPYAKWESYTSDFVRVLDFETLGLQEDYRLGHTLFLKLYPVTTALGSTHNFFGVSSGAYYTLALSDGMARAGVEAIVEANGDGVSDSLIEGREHFVTPRTALGRLVFDGLQLVRPQDSLNRRSSLGGDTRLRGYPTGYLVGKDVISYNLEFRTRPVEILTLQLGGAIFWDTGDAFDEFTHMNLKHGVGAGLRMLFPQLDRYVLRFDVGFPVVINEPRPVGTHPYELVLTFQQAFNLPAQSTGTVFTTR
jgi:hypothetical protein